MHDRLRVLIVDDDEMVGGAIARMLAREYACEHAVEASVALQRLLSGERFHAILCDLMMPGMTGTQFHAELATALPEHAKRVIFITGGIYTRDTHQYLSAVSNQCLDKPVVIADIRAAIEALDRAP